MIFNQLLPTLARYFNRLTPRNIFLWGCLFLLMVGVVDFLTASSYSSSSLYLLPILFGAWYGGRVSGLLLCGLAIMMMLNIDSFTLSKTGLIWIHFWDEVVRLLIFVFVAMIFSSLRKHLANEEKLARIDSLTKVPNRLAFYEEANIEIIRARRYKHPLSIAYLDIDNFKEVNDEFGHHEGDRLLIMTAAIIKENLRATDTVARLGGDEFAILLPDTVSSSADIVIEKIHASLRHIAEGHGWHVDFSIGTATFIDPPNTIDEMIGRADNLMYTIKKGGKLRRFID